MLAPATSTPARSRALAGPANLMARFASTGVSKIFPASVGCLTALVLAQGHMPRCGHGGVARDHDSYQLGADAAPEAGLPAAPADVSVTERPPLKRLASPSRLAAQSCAAVNSGLSGS